MGVYYKFNVLDALKERGYSSYKMRKDKIMGERTIQQLREGILVSWENIAKICDMLQCQPGDFLTYIPDGNSLDKEESS